MNADTIQISLFDYFMDDENFTLKEATELVKVHKNMPVNNESIRARIYEGIDRGIFKRVARGVYKVEKQLEGKATTCLLINGNGRDLSFIKDKSIDGIVTDHPYDLSKGEPRSLKLDAKKNIQLATEHGIDVKGLSSYQVKEILLANGLDVYYMKGTSGMLPKAFDFQPKNSKDKVMEAEKPVELLESIIEYISLPDELLLDQFGGSGNFAIACMNTKRDSIVIEKDEEMFSKMKDNVEENLQKVDGKLEVKYESFESKNAIEEEDYEYDF